MIDSPKGPYICPLIELQNRGDKRITGAGYGYTCQKLR
jgi:hypothetical protein